MRIECHLSVAFQCIDRNSSDPQWNLFYWTTERYAYSDKMAENSLFRAISIELSELSETALQSFSTVILAALPLRCSGLAAGPWFVAIGMGRSDVRHGCWCRYATVGVDPRVTLADAEVVELAAHTEDQHALGQVRLEWRHEDLPAPDDLPERALGLSRYVFSTQSVQTLLSLLPRSLSLSTCTVRTSILLLDIQ